jgi:hypothetical protein
MVCGLDLPFLMLYFFKICSVMTVTVSVSRYSLVYGGGGTTTGSLLFLLCPVDSGKMAGAEAETGAGAREGAETVAGAGAETEDVEEEETGHS